MVVGFFFAGIQLAGCAAVQDGAAPAGDLRSAREACNAQYPRKIGNYLPNALCVNAAVERYAMPSAPYPDLVRLQSQARAKLSEKVDERGISANTAAQRMVRVDALVAEAERDRQAGKKDAAARKIDEIETVIR
jgi:hypothetical protein